MSSTAELDLIGIAWPVCLLKFKTELNNLDSCEKMDVLAQDPEVVENIVMIIERSEDTLIDRRKDGKIYRLTVRRK